MIKDLQDIESAKILIIDDQEINLDIIEELFEVSGFSNLFLFSNPEEAVEFYRNNVPDITLLDLNMPVLSGFDVLQRFNEINHYPQPPVLIISAQNEREIRLKALDSGARDYLNKPFDVKEVISRVRNLLEMHLAHKENLSYSQNLESIVNQRTQELLETQMEIVERLALAAEYRDNETAAHTIRVGLYSQAIGKKLGLSDREAEQLKLAAPMHDLGKIGIPDKILLKPGKLDKDEWNYMKKHAEFGYDILKNSKSLLLKNAGIIALTHHEKWDGSGYPYGLKGTDIHVYGRITAVSDVFDALTMARPYKNAWTLEDAIKLMNDEIGKHFDPELIDVFNHLIGEFLVIKENHSD